MKATCDYMETRARGGKYYISFDGESVATTFSPYLARILTLAPEMADLIELLAHATSPHDLDWDYTFSELTRMTKVINAS